TLAGTGVRDKGFDEESAPILTSRDPLGSISRLLNRMMCFGRDLMEEGCRRLGMGRRMRPVAGRTGAETGTQLVLFIGPGRRELERLGEVVPGAFLVLAILGVRRLVPQQGLPDRQGAGKALGGACGPFQVHAEVADDVEAHAQSLAAR